VMSRCEGVLDEVEWVELESRGVMRCPDVRASWMRWNGSPNP